MSGYKRLFKKNGFTALRAARKDDKWMATEIAKTLMMSYHTVAKIFSKNYNQASWRYIIKVAELLGVEREDYIRREYLLNLPIEVELHFRSLESMAKPKPKMKRKKWGSKTEQPKPIAVEAYDDMVPATPMIAWETPPYIMILEGLQGVESVTAKTKNGTITWEA